MSGGHTKFQKTNGHVKGANDICSDAHPAYCHDRCVVNGKWTKGGHCNTKETRARVYKLRKRDEAKHRRNNQE